MQRRIPHKRSLLCAAISLSLLPLASQSIAQQDTVEEVVVTGSYIRRSEGFTGASSIVQLNAEDLEAQGTLNIGEVVQNLAFVNGSASAITNTIQGQDSRSTSIDLRGLGASSTLTLLDGKRLVNENVNALIPTIAIQRMDIVADGAAALYGNEAVAGVVNFVPYKSYDGFKMDTYAEQDTRGDYDEQSVQMMWGGEIGVLDVVVAAQHRTNTRLGWDERSDLANSGLTVSSNAPGNWFQPTRDANGQYTGDRTSTVDPNCAPASERTAYSVDQVNNAFGNRLGSNCFFDFGDNRSYREPQQIAQYFGNATWEVSDDLTLSAQGFRTYQRTNTFTSTSNPGNSRIGELPAVRGEIPGNPFFAVDAGGNQLYGVDMNGDGIPDRGTDDLNNDGTPDYIVSGTTDNGVLLREDMQARTLRPINKTHTRSSGHTADRDNKSNATDKISRFSLQADFTVPFIEGWEGMASYTHNTRDFLFMSNQNYSIGSMIQGLNCDVVNDRDACYNPFFVTNEADNNSLQVMDSIAARSKEGTVDELDVIDIILNGDVPLGGFELPGGPIAAAVGYQWRDDKFTNTPSLHELRGDTWIGGTEPEVITSGSREVDAYFLELSVPVLSNLEVELAVRREEFSTGQASTDPKYGVTYAPTDWLTLRATQGTAFIAPSLEQLFNPVTCGLSTVTDRFGPFSAFTTACGGGNRTLTNEESESKQLGFDLEFGNFDFHLTWNETDFENRIIGINGQDLMQQDFANFQAATGFAGNGVGAANQPSEQQLRDWVANPASNKDIIRDPGDIFSILQVDNTSTINAEKVLVEAYDIAANYRFSVNNWGDFRLGLQATFIDHFFYQGDPSAPIVDGAGRYNDVTAAAPELPEWKANLTIGWSMGNHSINTITRYIDEMPYDGPQFTHLDFFGGFQRPQNMDLVKTWTQMDASYTYRGIELFGGTGAVTVGSRNLFDKDPQPSPEFAGVIGGLQDPMGRNIYARFIYDF
ncbi:MAG: TonB-dependent receptor [Pseudohongiellaceae bacterium]